MSNHPLRPVQPLLPFGTVSHYSNLQAQYNQFFSLSVETPKIVKFPTGISFPLAGDNIFTPTDWGTFFVEVIEFGAAPVVESASAFTLLVDCGVDPSSCGRILP